MLTFTYLVTYPNGDASGTISALSIRDAEAILRSRYPGADMVAAVLDADDLGMPDIGRFL